MIAVGDLIRWTAGPMSVGRNWIVIRTGDMLRVVEVSGRHLALALPNGGVYGWTTADNVEKVNEL